MKKVILGLSILFVSSSLNAETLNDAFIQSYQNNPVLKSEQAKLRATDENYSQAVSGWRPSVNLVGNAGYVDSELKLEDGTKMSDGSMSPYSGSLVVSQPLFDGFDTVASEKSAENMIKAGRYSLISVEQDLLAQTVSAYTGVLYAEAALKLNINKEQVYKKHVDESKQKYEVGEITVTDYAQSEARYEGAKADRIASEGDLKNAKTYYETVTGVAPSELEEVTIPVSLLAESVDDALNRALSDNPAVKMAIYQEKSARNDVAKAGSSLLPSLDLQASGTIGKNQQYDNDKYNEFKATANLTVPLYEAGFSYSKVRQAKQTANQKRLDIDSARLNIKNSVYESWENLTAIKAKIVSYKSQIKAYEIAVDSTTKEWEVGTKTMVDVMDAEQDLLDAKLNEINAKRQEIIESFNLIALVGGLTMENLNINVDVYNPTNYYDKVKGKWLGTGINSD